MDKSGNSTDDEELDMMSPKFNPLKAIYSDKLNIASSSLPRFDNLSSFLSRLKHAGNLLDTDLSKIPQKSSKKDVSNVEDDKEGKYHVTAHGRRFLKEQAPIHRGPKAKYKRDIFVKMESMKGPLALLNKFKTNRTRVKVYIRKEHGIKGFICGIIEAFDKHFNIALVNCVEVWKRRKHKYSDNNVALLGPPEDCSKLLKSMGINVPVISTKSMDRKTVQCTRKIPQLMIRGEEVVLVSEDICGLI